MGYRVYIIPSNVLDSSTFSRENISSLTLNRPSWQIDFGDDFLSKLKEDDSNILLEHICNVPIYDTIYFSKAYISFEKLIDEPLLRKDKYGKDSYLRPPDSCNTFFLRGGDSSIFGVFRIYNF
jgi:hypothetical protein